MIVEIFFRFVEKKLLSEKWTLEMVVKINVHLEVRKI